MDNLRDRPPRGGHVPPAEPGLDQRNQIVGRDVLRFHAKQIHALNQYVRRRRHVAPLVLAHEGLRGPQPGREGTLRLADHASCAADDG
jgi:hypothetical protein